MDKFSELKAAAMAATPGPWFRSGVQFNGITTESTFITQGNKPHVASTSEKRDAIFIAAANPDTVLALLAELEVKDKRIGELEERENRVVALAGGNAELWETMSARLEAAEAKLATPVRLPNKSDDEFWFDGVFQAAKFDRAVERAISAAGFKFVGDE